MSCLTNPIGCGLKLLGSGIGSGIGDVASSAWDSICQSFANGASSLLKSFATMFVNIPNVDVASAGIKNVYAISLGIAALIAALLLIGQVIRTTLTHDGSALAQGLVGVGKAALAFLLTLTIAAVALEASDEIARYIVDSSFGGTSQFSSKVSGLVKWEPSLSGSLLLVFAVIAILLIIVLWFEMLLRNAAIAILVATSPIAASGQVAESTKSWWAKLVAATVQLIILKPIVALVFALGFGMAGQSQDVETTLSGMLVLLLAVVAWPVIARFFTFASVSVGGGAGLGAMLGFTAGRLGAPSPGAAAGISPEEFGQDSANRTMAAFANRAAAGEGATAAAQGAGLGAGTAAGAGPMGVAIAGLTMAQRAVNSLAGHMEQMAGHAGIQGANPYAQPAGYAVHRGPTWSGRKRGTSDVQTGSSESDEATSDDVAPDVAEPAGQQPATHELPVTGPSEPDVDSGPAAAPPPTTKSPLEDTRRLDTHEPGTDADDES